MCRNHVFRFARSAASAATLWIVVVMLSLAPGSPTAAMGSEKTSVDPCADMFFLGRTGSDPVQIELRTNGDLNRPLKVGESVFFSVKADRKCYISVLSISSAGDVTVLFPNRLNKNNFLEAGKFYTLLGGSSPVRLLVGKGLPPSKIVFYVSTRRVSLDVRDSGSHNPVREILHSDCENLNTLQNMIALMAEDPGFNRAVLSARSLFCEVAGRDTREGLIHKGIPSGKESPPPETILGTQGNSDRRNLVAKN